MLESDESESEAESVAQAAPDSQRRARSLALSLSREGRGWVPTMRPLSTRPERLAPLLELRAEAVVVRRQLRHARLQLVEVARERRKVRARRGKLLRVVGGAALKLGRLQHKLELLQQPQVALLGEPLGVLRLGGGARLHDALRLLPYARERRLGGAQQLLLLVLLRRRVGRAHLGPAHLAAELVVALPPVALQLLRLRRLGRCLVAQPLLAVHELRQPPLAVLRLVDRLELRLSRVRRPRALLGLGLLRRGALLLLALQLRVHLADRALLRLDDLVSLADLGVRRRNLAARLGRAQFGVVARVTRRLERGRRVVELPEQLLPRRAQLVAMRRRRRLQLLHLTSLDLEAALVPTDAPLELAHAHLRGRERLVRRRRLAAPQLRPHLRQPQLTLERLPLLSLRCQLELQPIGGRTQLRHQLPELAQLRVLRAQRPHLRLEPRQPRLGLAARARLRVALPARLLALGQRVGRLGRRRLQLRLHPGQPLEGLAARRRRRRVGRRRDLDLG